MRRTLLHSLVPAAVALMMSLGIVMTAAAEPDTETDAETTSLVPAWTVLDQLVELGILPAEAREALLRVRLEHAEHTAPGAASALCRRVASATDAPAELIERCREAHQDDDHLAPAAACRRVAAATDPSDALVERCRTWLSSEGAASDGGRLAFCRRVANAESVDATLVERCRAILADAPARPEERPARESRSEPPNEGNPPALAVPSSGR